MQGTVVRVGVAEGQRVESGELVAVLEGMKMEIPVTAHKAGTVHGLTVTVGDAVAAGTAICDLRD